MIWALLALLAVLLVALAARPGTLGDAGDDSPSATVAVVVPARNEATTVPTLLASLADQARRADEIVVVDDDSSDDTASLAARGGATVVGAGALPAGWTGKTWACARGVEATDAELLVLVDADVALAPDALARLIAEHRRRAADGLLSVQPHHVAERPYEQLSALPNLVAVLASGLAALRPRRESPIAFGPCLVTTRTALAAVGGFAAVRGAVLEDVALAQQYRRAGRPVCCALGGATVRFRMYPGGLRQLIDGWSKHLAGGATSAPPLTTLGAVAVVAALAAVVAAWPAAPWWTVVSSWALVAGGLALAFRRAGRFRWWTPLIWPVLLVAFVGLFGRSLWWRYVRRSVNWRGRTLSVRD